MAFSLANFKRDFPDYEWLPLKDGVDEFLRVNDEQGTFPDAASEIFDDRIIKAWKHRLAGW